MKNIKPKKSFSAKKIIALLIIVFSLAFYARQIFALPGDTGSKERSAAMDELMRNTWLKDGASFVPDSAVKETEPSGTRWTKVPSLLYEIVSRVALQYGGVYPPGVKPIGSDMLSTLKDNQYINDKDKSFYQAILPTVLGFLPEITEQSPLNEQQKKDYKIKDQDSFMKEIVFNPYINALSLPVIRDASLQSKARILAATAPDLNQPLPKYEGENKLGENTGSSIGQQGSPYEQAEGVVITQSANANRADLLEEAVLVSIANATDGGSKSVTSPDEKMPSAVGDDKIQKPITSTQVAGNAAAAGDAQKATGIVGNEPGSPIANLNDIIRLAANNAANNIGNRINQLANAQNRFPGGRLNNLQNNFSPNRFQNLLNNRFPGSGSGGSGGGGSGGNGGGPAAPPASANSGATEPCKEEDAAISRQDATDIADFMNLPKENVTTWTYSYFPSGQMLGQRALEKETNTEFVFNSSIIPDPKACAWVVYEPSSRIGVFIADIVGQNAARFLFVLR